MFSDLDVNVLISFQWMHQCLQRTLCDTPLCFKSDKYSKQREFLVLLMIDKTCYKHLPVSVLDQSDTASLC